jgi:enterobacteria phage integrase
MAARRRDHKTKDLPPNLYCRGGYYSYRDPRTGKEYGLGRDKRFAVNESVAANMEMMPAKVSLVDKINGKEVVFFDELIELFKTDLKGRGLSEKTAKDNDNKIKHISLAFSGMPLDQVTTKEISIFLDTKVSEGKSSYAKILRTTLSDMFKTGIRKGIVTRNPAADTRVSKIEVEKDRLLLEEYIKIRSKADSMQPWVGLALDLALTTGQRVGDLVNMKWTDISDNKLNVIQSKTKKMLRISLDNKIEIFDLSIKTVTDKLKEIAGNSEFILGGRSQKIITGAYREARKAAAIEWKKKPAPFHEIRSLSGRLYLKQKNIEFAQNILGHENIEMTLKYIDGRQKEWLDI